MSADKWHIYAWVMISYSPIKPFYDLVCQFFHASFLLLILNRHSHQFVTPSFSSSDIFQETAPVPLVNTDYICIIILEYYKILGDNFKIFMI